MAILVKKGDKGDNVKLIQKALGIESDGVFGKMTEDAVKNYQKKNNLTADGIVGQITWNKLFNVTATQNIQSESDINILKGYIYTHITKSLNRPIKYIAIHYTAGGTSKPGTAMATRNVFLKRNASADFVVDDRDIVQINPDLKNYFCWSVGDKKNQYSKGGKLYGKATNKNTVSIEMCSSLMNGWKGLAPNHEGWYITDKVVNNTLKLVKYLMKKFNIPKDNVIRHYDVSGKLCPGVEGWNPEPIYDNNGKKTNKVNNESEWIKFKSKI